MFDIPLSIAFVIFVWLKTNAVYDFIGGWLCRWNILYFKDYSVEKDQIKLTYSVWLYFRHTNFLTKLISCPLCLSFWVNVAIGKSIEGILCGAFVSLVAFSVLDKLYKHS